MPENPTTSPPNYRNYVVSNPDGTYTRLLQLPTVPANSDPTSPVLSKDIPVNPSNKTWLRVYLPRHHLNSNPDDCRRLPLIVYFHGGGFIFTTADSKVNHDFCVAISQRVNAVVVSVDYHCAPEHRLPAAYDDAFEALEFVGAKQEDDWLREFADLSNCFLMGSSAGGNIAYQTGLRWCKSGRVGLTMKGLVLHQPFFGGSERTRSEVEMENDGVLPLDGSDFMWEVSLPVGADRDHEYCNPVRGFDSDTCRRVRKAGIRVMVLGCYGDPLIDRQVAFCEMLDEKGVKCVGHFRDGHHGLELMDSMFVVLNEFMYS